MNRNTIHIDTAVLEDLMRSRGLNRVELAEKLNVQRQTISHWLQHGRMRSENFDTLITFFKIERSRLERNNDEWTGWDIEALAAALEAAETVLARYEEGHFDWKQRAIVIEQCYHEASHNRDTQLLSTAVRVFQILSKAKSN